MLSLFASRFPAAAGAGLTAGVDLSGWNPVAIWDRLGWADWSCSKVSEGPSFTELAAIDHSAAAAAKGIPWGLYHFARFSEVTAEAARYLAGVATVQANVGAGPAFHMLDLEAEATGDVTAWAEQWCQQVEQHHPAPVVVYTGPGWANVHLRTGGTGLERRPLWVAHYAPSGTTEPWVPDLWDGWHVWQWTSTSDLGSLDLNVARPAFLELIDHAGGGATGALPNGDDDDMPKAYLYKQTPIMVSGVTFRTYATRPWPDVLAGFLALEAEGRLEKMPRDANGNVALPQISDSALSLYREV